MLQNAYLLAKIGDDTAENEQHFAKNLRKTDNYVGFFDVATLPGGEVDQDKEGSGKAEARRRAMPRSQISA